MIFARRRAAAALQLRGGTARCRVSERPGCCGRRGDPAGCPIVCGTGQDIPLTALQDAGSTTATSCGSVTTRGNNEAPLARLGGGERASCCYGAIVTNFDGKVLGHKDAVTRSGNEALAGYRSRVV
jgi:hypothetical protein